MSRARRQLATRLTLQQLESRETPTVWVSENFDLTTVGALPTGWSQWSSAGNAFAVAATQPSSTPNSLASNGASNVTARSWATVATGADAVVSTNVYTSSLVPTEVFARGQNLNSAAATFYAASISRGINVQLVKTVNGVRTVLGTLTSAAYTSYQWSKVTLRTTGSSIQVEVKHNGTGQYLNSQGQWQTQQTNAISVTDSAITAGGQVGVNRPAAYAGTVNLDDFKAEGPDATTPPPPPPPTGGTTISQAFDTTAVGALPTGWQRYVTGTATAAVQAGPATSSPNRMVITATGTQTARVWASTTVGPNVEVSANVFVDSLIGAQLIARGSSLNTASPTFYAVEITRGLGVKVTKTINGIETKLAEGASTNYISYQWIKPSIKVEGSTLQVYVQRLDNNSYLTGSGGWSTSRVAFKSITDTSISTAGLVGLGHGGPYSGTIVFDNFVATSGSSTSDGIAPTVALTAPTNLNVSGTVAIAAQASDNVGVAKVEFWLDNQLQSTDSQSPYNWSFNSTTVANGNHALLIKAFDAAGNVGTASATLNVQNSGGPVQPPGGPTFPSHYSHIRIAQLAYYGTPMTAFEQGLLQNSVDLVIPNTNFLNTIDSIAPNTPQLIYGNLSNVYQDLLVDWLMYADQNTIDRETAFYHVAQATNFTGGSPSSQPVNWLWRVARNTTNLTGESRTGTTGDVALGSTVGDVVYFGYLEKFRELNFNITTASGTGWSAVYEYPTAVDANGIPTAWATFTPVTNTTNNLRQSGRVTFDPPANWKKSVASGTTPLFFVRLRVTAAASAPVAATILGRDYVAANGTTSGVIPAFDSNADGNGDGYLTDGEYAQRAAGKDGRFRYESRLFYPAYGQMRFAVNPGPTAVRTWAGDMLNRMFTAFPLADGLFVDNSNGKSPAIGITTVESTANYSSEYGQMMAVVGNAIAPRWLMANTTGGGTYTDQVVQNSPGVMEEFALRPLDSSWSRFLDVAGLVANRLSAANAPYVVLDSHPQGGSQTDARTQLATLAYYYLLGDPIRTFLMFYGGVEPSTSWTRHWSPAAAYNIGQPTGTWSEWATGNDPANAALQYKVYRRNYGNAIVLYKPLSYKVAVGTGTLADNTVTVHQLGGTYRPLRADGTLGPAVTSISLRNGEGAILIPS